MSRWVLAADALRVAAAGEHPWPKVADGFSHIVGAGAGAPIRRDTATGAVDLLGSRGMPEAETTRYSTDLE
jgi:hypothetical protein